MLSWEEYESPKIKKENPKETEVLAEEPVQVKAQEPEPTDNPLPSEGSDRLTKSREKIAKFDQKMGEEALAGMGTRVHVDQKAMINCRADVNQLVPFKYDWAWQKYLDG